MRETAVRPAGAFVPLMTAALIALTVVALAFRPATALVGILALCGVAVIVMFARALPVVFLGSVGVLLAGYAFFGRSFAYLGAPPLFVGEMMLAFGIVAALTSGALLNLVRSPVMWLLAAFSAWGAARTWPYVSEYGFDALRDATLWGYSGFAIAVAACVLGTESIPAIARRYKTWIVQFTLWLPAGILIARILGASQPNMPGTGIPLLSMKAGDAGVHLGGAALFMLLGLYGSAHADVDERRRGGTLFWVSWAVSLVMVAAVNRGGFLAALCGLVLICLLEPIFVGKRFLAYGIAAVSAAVVIVALSTNLQDTSKVAVVSEERSLSPQQVVENIASIVGRESGRGNLSSTRQWRLDWWGTIVDYTFFGRYFWEGKGFGINLADDDGFQVASDDQAPLRSPHNAYMTVLARMGVPGIVLWMMLQIAFGWSLVAAFFRARYAGAIWWARLNLWILGYWVAFLVNAAFDVFLEGPQGGIWFWCLMGFGVAALEWQRRDLSATDPALLAAR